MGENRCCGQPEGDRFFLARGVCKKACHWKGACRCLADTVRACTMPSVFHDVAKAADIPGFRDRGVHSGFSGKFEIVRDGIGGHGNGRRVFVCGVVWLPAGDGAAGLFHVTFHFVSSTRLPPAIIMPPAMTRQLTGSFRMTNDRMMVMTTLSLSIGATKETSPA